MENRNGYQKQNSGLWRSLRDGDFEEADVWSVLKDGKDSSYSKVGQSLGIESPYQIQRSLNMPSAARMIRRTSSSSSSSSNNNYSRDGVMQQQSAPVKIPDWPKKSNKKSKMKAHYKNNYHAESDDDDDDHGVLDDDHGVLDDDDDDDEDDVYDCKVPPHEFIAERLANSHISSFSVFEGVGRTLKGRDLSKVRNAVLTRTGFLE